MRSQGTGIKRAADDVEDALVGSEADSGTLRSYLIVIPWDLESPGGVNQVVLSLSRELRRRRTLRPVFLVLDWAYRRPVADRENPSIVRYRLREPAEPLVDAGAFVKWALSQPLAMLRLRRLITEHRVAAINVHYPTVSSVTFALLKLVRLCPARLVLSFHGQDIKSSAELKGLPRRLFRFLLRSADAVTACSHGFAQRVRELFPADCGEIHVIHNGVDPASIEGELARSDAEAIPNVTHPYALCVSGFVAKKALEVLVEAFKSIRVARPDLTLVIVGRSGPEWPRIEGLVRDANLAKAVTLMVDASHSSITRLMRDAALFVLPSRDEPFGIVLLEAGLAGLPVVATRVGGIPEIIASSEYGILVPPDDPGALAAAVLELLQDCARAQSVGERLRERVLSCFSAATTADRYLKTALD